MSLSTGALSMEEQEQAKPSRQMLLERKLGRAELMQNVRSDSRSGKGRCKLHY